MSLKKYENILKTHKEIIARAENLGLCMVKVDCVGKIVDIATLMNTLYKNYYVVVVKYEMLSKESGLKIPKILFGIKPGVKFYILDVLKNIGVETSGFSSKTNINPEDEKASTQEAPPNALWEVRKVERGCTPYY